MGRENRGQASSKRTDFGLRQMHEIVVAHAHRIVVRTRVKHNFRILRQRLVDVNRQVIEGAKWRHSPEFAIGEQTAELRLRCQAHRLSDGGCQLV